MEDKAAIKLFETKRVRTAWNEDEEEWYFSVVDVVGVLTDSPDPKRYWSVLKTRLKQEGIESTTICSTLKLLAEDGKWGKICTPVEIIAGDGKNKLNIFSQQ